MIEFEVSTIINRPTDIVTEALNNPNNFPYWQSDLEKFEIVKGGPNQVGSIGCLHYSQRGRPYMMEDKLIYCELGRKYISEVTGDALIARVETTLEPLEDKTRMNLRWQGEGKAFPLKLLLPLFRGKIAKQAKNELDTFKNLVESRGCDFSS